MASCRFEIRVEKEESCVSNVCRLCATAKDKNDLIHILGEQGVELHLQAKIFQCLDFEVQQDDVLPQTVCSSCCNDLQVCHTFLIKSHIAQRKLLAFINDEVPLDSPSIQTDDEETNMDVASMSPLNSPSIKTYDEEASNIDVGSMVPLNSPSIKTYVDEETILDVASVRDVSHRSSHRPSSSIMCLASQTSDAFMRDVSHRSSRPSSSIMCLNSQTSDVFTRDVSHRSSPSLVCLDSQTSDGFTPAVSHRSSHRPSSSIMGLASQTSDAFVREVSHRISRPNSSIMCLASQSSNAFMRDASHRSSPSIVCLNSQTPDPFMRDVRHKRSPSLVYLDSQTPDDFTPRSDSTSFSTQVALIVAENAIPGNPHEPAKTSILNLLLIDLKYLEQNETVATRISNSWKEFKEHASQNEKNGKYWSEKDGFGCVSCGIVLPNKTELISHFEERHPSEVRNCSECGETICGPEEVYDAHQHIHRHGGPSKKPTFSSSFPAEKQRHWVLIPLGHYNPLILQKDKKKEQALKLLKQVNKCKLIHPICKRNIQQSLQFFLEKFETSLPKSCKKTIECNICDKKFTLKKTLVKHLKDFHASDNQFERCIHCPKMVRPKVMNEHVQICHFGGEQLLCVFCDKIYQETGEDQPHMMLANLPHQCNACNNTFESQKLLERHIRVTHTEKKRSTTKDAPTEPFLCHNCGNVYLSKAQLRRHIHDNHELTNGGNVPCDMCDKTFINNKKLYLHKSWVHVRKTVECTVCKKQVTKYQINKHMRTHLQPQYVCKYCGKRLTSPGTLRLHESKHEGTKVKCPICDIACATQELLDQHQKIHFNSETEEIYIAPYLREVQCEICDQVLKNRVIYNQHMKTHELGGPVPVRIYNFLCDICDSKFSKQETLDYHMISCHSEGSNISEMFGSGGKLFNPSKLQCQYCKKKFKNEFYKIQHERVKHTHVGEKNYECQQCPSKFSYPSGLYSHMQSVHGLPKKRSRITTVDESFFPHASQF